MNEMYDMSIVTHNFGVIGVLAVVLVNILLLLNAGELNAYRRKMTLFTPIGSTMIATIIFTGVIMMAAKHLDFTFANIVMIVFATVFVTLEVKRMMSLKRLNSKELESVAHYKRYALNILLIEAIMVLIVSAWMWM